MKEPMVEIYIMLRNSKSVYAYYDGDATLSEIIKDLEANQCKIHSVDYSTKGSMNTFVINVD
jgi:hypothetical protein